MIKTREIDGFASFDLNFCIKNLKAFSSDQHVIESHDNSGNTIPPLAAKFSKLDTNILGLADEEGGIVICDISKTGPSSLKQEWMAHSNAIFDIEWSNGTNNFLTASGDKTVALWDIEREEQLSSFHSHTSSVKSVCFQLYSQNVFASGGRDGYVHLWDTRVKKKANGHHPVNSIHIAHQIFQHTGKKKKINQNQGAQQSVTCVLFQSEHNLITAGNMDGNIKVWDIRKMYQNLKSDPVPKDVFPYGGKSKRAHGFSNLTLDSSRTRLFGSCMDHTIYQYDCAAFTQAPVATFDSHKNNTFYVKASLSPCDTYLISGSSDNNAYIWNVENPMKNPVILEGHVGEVSSVAWSPNSVTDLITTSDDGTMLVWRVYMPDDRAQNQLGTFVGHARCESTEFDYQKCEWKTRLFPRPPRVEDKNTMQSPVKQQGASLYNCRYQESPRRPTSASLLLSPMKGTTLRRSPAKISSTVKRAIKELNSSSAKTKFNKSSQAKLTSWLNRSKVDNKHTKTPKKLVITPRKQGANQQLKSGIVDQSEDTRSVANNRQTYKRKLADAFGCDSPSKNTSENHQKSKCSRQEKTLPTNCDKTVLKNVLNISPEITDVGNSSITDNTFLTPIKEESGICSIFDDKTPSKTITPPKTPVLKSMSTPTNIHSMQSPAMKRMHSSPMYRSPTANLPNYVLNPERRTPVDVIHTTPKRSSDWLTKMRNERSGSCQKEAQVEEATTLSGKKKKSSSVTTPKSSKKNKKCSMSIEKFFSPKDSKKT